MHPTQDFANYEPSYCVDGLGESFIGISPVSTLYGESFDIADNDLLTFTLDLISRKWFVRVDNDKNNGKDMDLSHIQVSDDIKYKFVVQMQDLDTSVTLTNFDIELFS